MRSRSTRRIACLVWLLAPSSACTSEKAQQARPEPTVRADGQGKPKAEPALETERRPAPVGSAECRRAMASLAEPEHLPKLWTQELREWLAGVDRRLGRMSQDQPLDVVEIDRRLEALAQTEDEHLRARELGRTVAQLRSLSLLEMRRLLTAAADGQGDLEVQWDEARCLWQGALLPLARRVDERGGEEWAASVSEVFEAGRTTLDDELARKVARQRIEKSSYALLYRELIACAERQTAAGSGEAQGLLLGLEDRVATRNAPGYARIQTWLAGDPAALDPDQVERELAVAFTKRARKYCDRAVETGVLATPEAIAETWEGVVYTKVILAGMREALAAEGFDADGHSTDWLDYLEAVKAGDRDAAAAISARLVEWNCAYQAHLGLDECSSSRGPT